MTRALGVALGAIALVAIGFFIQEASQILGIIERAPAGTAPAGGGPGGMPHGGMPSPGSPGYSAAPDMNAPIPVEVAPAVVRGIRERVRGSGLLEPIRQVMLVARVEGEVQELLVEEGTRVESGAELCVIDEELLRIAAEIARIEQDKAKRSHQRLVELVASRSVSPQELEDASSALDRATAQREKTDFDLAHARPKAPFAGVIVDRAIELGQTVRPGEVLFTIADFEPLWLRLHLPESEVAAVVVGQVAELRADRDGPMLTRGSVERISPVVDRESLTVEVITRFEFAAGQVRPGSFGHVDIITRTEADVVLVPRRALIRAEGEVFVYRVFDERAHRTPILIGYEDDAVIQVREGIAPGDRVVTEGGRELRDGARVEIYRETPTPLDPLTVERRDLERGDAERGDGG